MHHRTILGCLAFLLPALILAGCGGGGGGGGGGAPPGPSLTVNYSENDVVYRTDAPIVANAPAPENWTPTSFVVEPTLPDGLVLDPTTGVISGSPTGPSPRTAYTITASDEEEHEVAVTVRIEIAWAMPKSLEVAEDLDEDDLRHFLLRTHWGVTAGKLAELQSEGLSTFLDGMLSFPAIDSTTWEQDAKTHLYNDELPAGQEHLFPNRTQMIRWWLYLMKNNENPFQEVLAMHWHDHFATSSEVLGGGRSYYMVKHVNMLREKGVGNLRDFLLAISRDWAMLWWLDGYISTKNNPNENFGREWLELFCLGVDNGYQQADIVEAARAFTGYQDRVLDEDTGLRHMEFIETRHDDEDKTVLGQLIPGQNVTDDYAAMVDITVDHGPAAEWFALSLLRGFVMDEPDQALVDQLAQVLRDENYELAPTLRALFRSEAFFSDEARGSLVKSPVDHALGFQLSTGLRVRVNELHYALDDMGNVPTMPPTVDGWPGGEQWLSAHGMVERANLLRDAIGDSDSIEEQELFGLDLRALLPPGTPTSLEVVDALALHLGVKLTPDERTRLAEYLDTRKESSGEVVADPFDPANPEHVEERIRGLLYILGQHPTYMVR